MPFKLCHGKFSNLLIYLSVIWFAANFIIFRNKLNFGENQRAKIEAPPKYPGEKGTPVHLPLKLSKKDLQLIEQGWSDNKFNQYVSDMIPLNRSLPDVRDEWCKQPENYVKNLPVTDIIICFHNEAWSTLVRTVVSVMNRSPAHLIGQIILVDDYSNMAHLQEPLSKYFSTNPKVKIVRANKREGLIRARLIGINHSTAPVLTFLDSHCECTEGWLEPLLDRIARNPTTVVSPFIDIIERETFEYIITPLNEMKFLGGFKWRLEYFWFKANEERTIRDQNEMAPYVTPTIAGGLFSIDRQFFEHLGFYDPGYEYWGSENLELSFKTWMCGGRLEMVYCSRVGHVFRKQTPYVYPLGNQVVIKNAIRLAEVWLDDYAHIYYKNLGSAFNFTEALTDVSDRKKLRKSLNCQNFKWYLDNVYPEKFIPVAMGAINLKETDLCLQAKDDAGNVNIFECHNNGGKQFWMFTDLDEIRKDETCLTANGSSPVLAYCDEIEEGDGRSQWIFSNSTYQISNQNTKQCLTLSPNRENLLMENCRKRSWRQRWILK